MGNHTRPPCSSQAKISCNRIELKRVAKYKLAEYIECGWPVERLVQLTRFPVDPV